MKTNFIFLLFLSSYFLIFSHSYTVHFLVLVLQFAYFISFLLAALNGREQKGPQFMLTTTNTPNTGRRQERKHHHEIKTVLKT